MNEARLKVYEAMERYLDTHPGIRLGQLLARLPTLGGFRGPSEDAPNVFFDYFNNLGRFALWAWMNEAQIARAIDALGATQESLDSFKPNDATGPA